MAVRGLMLPHQPPTEGIGGGGGKVNVAPWETLMAVRGPTPPHQPPAEGIGGGGGKVNVSLWEALMAVRGPTPPYQLAAEDIGGGGGEVNVAPWVTLMAVRGRHRLDNRRRRALVVAVGKLMLHREQHTWRWEGDQHHLISRQQKRQ
jgi:hypothetical protein